MKKKTLKLSEKPALWSLLKNFHFFYFCLFLLAFIYVLPFILWPAFNLIDDGASLQAAQRLMSHLNIETWVHILNETQVGRFRPLYHIWFLSIYLFFGTQPFFYWAGQALLLGATLSLMTCFLWKVTREKLVACLFPLILLLFGTTADNFYRLGTAEPKQMVVGLLFFLWLCEQKNKVWSFKKTAIGVLTLWTALLFKETSVIFVAVLLAFIGWEVVLNWSTWRQNWLKNFAFSCSLLLLSVPYFLLIPRGNGYGGGFHFNVTTIWGNFMFARINESLILFPFAITCVATFARFCYSIKFLPGKVSDKLQPFVWPFLLIITILLTLLIGIFPWLYQLPRYFYPVYVLTLVYIAVEASAWYQLRIEMQKASILKQLSSLSFGVFLALLLQRFVFTSALGFSLDPQGAYARLLQLSLEHSETLLFLALSASLTIVRLSFIYFKKKKLSFHLLYLPVTVLCLAIFSIVFSVAIWQVSFNRAWYVTNFLILYSFFVEFKAWFQNKSLLPKDHQHIYLAVSGTWIAVVILLVGFVFQGNGLRLWLFLKDPASLAANAFDTHQVSYGLIRYLLKDAPENAQVFLVGDDYEVVYEIGLYASHFETRPITFFTSNQQVVRDLKPMAPYLNFAPDTVQSFASSSAQLKLLVIRQKDVSKLPLQDTQLRELPPAATFGTIPSYAFWDVITKTSQ